MTISVLTTTAPPLFDEARIAVAGYLARDPETTRRSYASDLLQFFAWCDFVGLRAFEVRRAHLELWARSVEERGLAPSTIGRREPSDHALACVLGILGLRVSQACSLNIEDLSTERRHRTIRFVGKGSKLALMPLPPRVARTLELVGRGAPGRPLLLTKAGTRLNRHASYIVNAFVAGSG